jgi:cyclase
VEIPVIASGGAWAISTTSSKGSWRGHASAVLAASIFHFGTHTIPEAKAHLAAAGIPVRMA